MTTYQTTGPLCSNSTSFFHSHGTRIFRSSFILIHTDPTHPLHPNPVRYRVNVYMENLPSPTATQIHLTHSCLLFFWALLSTVSNNKAHGVKQGPPGPLNVPVTRGLRWLSQFSRRPCCRCTKPQIFETFLFKAETAARRRYFVTRTWFCCFYVRLNQKKRISQVRLNQTKKEC